MSPICFFSVWYNYINSISYSRGHYVSTSASPLHPSIMPPTTYNEVDVPRNVLFGNKFHTDFKNPGRLSVLDLSTDQLSISAT